MYTHTCTYVYIYICVYIYIYRDTYRNICKELQNMYMDRTKKQTKLGFSHGSVVGGIQYRSWSFCWVKKGAGAARGYSLVICYIASDHGHLVR